MKQPTPIDSRQNDGRQSTAAPEKATASLTEPGIVDEIRRRAYELYEERGKQHGFEQEDWTRAEAEIRNKYHREKSA